MKKRNYIFIAIIAVLASFMLQVVWVVNAFKDTTEKISQGIDDLMVDALFEEVNSRSANIPMRTMIQIPQPATDYSAYNNYQYLNDGVYKIIHKDINYDSLAISIDTMKKEAMDYDYIIYKVYKNGQSKIVYKSKHQPDWILTSVKSGVIPTRGDSSENIQIAFLNPYNLFIKEMGLIVVSSFLIALLLIWCIAKQVNLIRIQRKTMQMRKDFTYAMVHDMKTPLSTIILGVGFLEKEKVDNDKELKSKYHRILKDEAQRLMGLVSKILTISKLEEGKLEMNKEEVELLPMIENMEEKFTTKATKPLTFRNNIEAGTVFADAEYLGEAISNLIDNAIKYSKDSIEIEVNSKKTAAGTVISVRDNGIGISKKDQKVIFDKFERASASGRTFKKNGPSGFGLGLNYVLQVIEAHGGIVGVDSEVGKYSEFTLLLPKGNEE